MADQHFVPLHLHTEFSLLDGAIKIPKLLDFAKEQGWKACGISDHGNIFGAVKFFQLAKKAGIKPILGVEMYHAPDINIRPTKEEKKYCHITLIVQNEAGYRNLCQLFEFAYTKGFYFKPRIDYEMLAKHSDGLIVLSGCRGGHIAQLLATGQETEADRWIQWQIDHFGKERFFIEVMPPEEPDYEPIRQKLFEKAAQFGLDVVATADSHYLKPCDKEAHEVLLAVGTKAFMTDEDRMSFGELQAHVKTADEMLAAFPGHEEAIWNSGKIADLCNFEFTFGKLHFPKFNVPESHTEQSYFEQLCRDGLNRIFDKQLAPVEKRAIYEERLETEMKLITQMGFIGYFLVVGDFIAWAKAQGIPVGPGRGSAAGSLVAWALQITNIDPIEHQLLFERFLNPERVTMPDIDIDFCIERREEVINYVKDRYGHDSVCQIITFGTMLAKGVIKDVGRTLGIPFQDTQALTDLVGDELGITLKQAIEKEPKLADAIRNNSRIQKLFDICFTLEGLTRHASKHAAGVVIAPEPLRNVVPLYIPPKTTDLVTQYAMTELEAVGYLKMDFLGLKNLTVIDRCVKAIAANYKIHLDMDKLPLDDTATFDTLTAGKTNGVFQFEGDGVTKVIQKLKPSRFGDLVAVNALYRPGPLGSGMVDDFIDRRHGRKEVTYPFPELEPILEETYGVIVYQEQVMKIASAIAGFSLGAADILRRAMGKKKVDVMAQQKSLFVAGAVKRGFDEKKSSDLFELMAYFAGYGFNKSHSAAYALIAYQTAYLKTHYPAEFAAALLSFETTDPEKLSEHLQKTREQGLNVLKPDINRSEIEFRAVDRTSVLFGLKGIKNIGDAALTEIMATRQDGPFRDLFDFCKRSCLRTINKRVIESLILSGATDVLPGSRAQKIEELDIIMGQAQAERDAEKHGQVGLFQAVVSTTSAGKPRIYEFNSTAQWTPKEELSKEKEVVGFYLSSHPLDAHRDLARWLNAKDFMHLDEVKSEWEEIYAVGLLKGFKIITTKRGDKMAFAEFEDLGSSCEGIIFPSLFRAVEMALNEDTIYVLRGTVDKAPSSKPKIKLSELIPADIFFEAGKAGQTLLITMPGTPDAAACATLLSLLPKGPIALAIRFKDHDRWCTLHPKQKFDYTAKILSELEAAGFTPKILPPKREKPAHTYGQRFGSSRTG